MKKYPLPILYTLVSSARLMRDKWRAFLALSWPYLAVTVATQVLQSHSDETDSVPLLFLYCLMVMVAMAWATVRLHREILLNRQSSPADSPPSGLRELRILGYWLMMFIAIMVVVFGWVVLSSAIGLIHERSGVWIQILVGAVGTLPMIWLVSRWGLVIPATAIDDEPRGLRFAWRLSQEHKGALFILTGIIPMSSGLLISSLPADGNWAIALGFGLISYLAWANEICILSLSYQWIVQRQTIDKMLQQSHLKLVA